MILLLIKFYLKPSVKNGRALRAAILKRMPKKAQC